MTQLCNLYKDLYKAGLRRTDIFLKIVHHDMC